MTKIFTFNKIYRAYLDCRKTKRKTINALKFEYNLERNLFMLQKELETKTYKPGRSICFVVKNPSPREIFAASFRDRVVHHILIREIEKSGERELIFDTFSCRKNKGTHLAVERLKSFVKKATENYKKEAFYLKLDISGFFMAIDHNILYSLFEKLVLKQNKSRQWKDEILWLAKVIIFHKPTENYIIKSQPALFKLIPQRKSLFGASANKGLPIGNYSSQFFANLYLDKLDQFVKRNIKCKYYVRYVDDLVLLNKSTEKLKYFRNKINLFLKNNLDLELNSSKTKLFSVSRGIEFLGYFIKPGYVLAKQSVVKRLKNKLYFLNQKIIETIDLKNVSAMLNSYYGHFGHAFSFNLRRSIYEKDWGGGA
ncbi:MAG: RNA-directed DNA polymerase [Candidatus Staskawiczbacteria bacterium]|nr:RNA-directed DNA polymerase [Candidatus Staskawiczbacteria bacterium]